MNTMVPIGKLFEVEKGELQSTKCTPGEYDFITAAEDWKTHNEYSHECEALIFAAAASGSLGRTHYVDGKFTTSDLCYILTPKDEAKYPLNLSFYHFVFNSLRATLVAATKSGTSKESINQANFKNYEIPYFDIELQDFWVEKLKNTLGLKDLLGGELTHQQTLLKKLRQQILQEAIEGKLTADWRAQNPDVEPASELLKRIAAEKAQLVKDKKIKAQKPLPPITDEEKPFELPQGWEWCRLGGVTINYEAGKSFKCADRDVTGKEWGVIKTSAVTSGTFVENENKFYQESTPKDKSKMITVGDMIFCRASGSKGLAGKCCIVNNVTKNLLLSDKTPRLRVSSLVKDQFIFFHNETEHTGKYYSSLNTGKSTSMNNITKDQLFCKPVPLPPFPEQQVIVTKVEKLLALCDQLEARITHNQTHAEQLMQAVLKEAFSHNSEAEPAAKNSKDSAQAPEVIRA